jgi:hypothetical protein
MSYTPNRLPYPRAIDDAMNQVLQTGFVLAVGGHSNTHYDYGKYGSLNGLLAVWDSWVDNFFSVTSNTSSLILLLDERDFNRLNLSTTKKGYLDNILVNNMNAKPVDCARFARRPHLKHHYTEKWKHSDLIEESQIAKTIHMGCSNEVKLDQIYHIYYVDLPINATTGWKPLPLIIFASVFRFPPPKWAENKDEEELYATWRPAHIKPLITNYGYVKLTNWYSYHMLQLRIIDFFAFGGKLDSDVTFAQPFPIANLPLRLVQNSARLFISHYGWYYDAPQVSNGQRGCLDNFIANENKICMTSSNNLIPSGLESHSLLWETNLNTTVMAHFLVFWFGIYAAQETVHLARYWNNYHPWGMWDFRWGDQQWWPRPLSMFSEQHISKDIDHFGIIETENGKYVLHKAYPLHLTLKDTSYYNSSGSNKESRKIAYEIAAKKFK